MTKRSALKPLVLLVPLALAACGPEAVDPSTGVDEAGPAVAFLSKDGLHGATCAMAVMGGRNIADAYFQRGEGAAFLDLELLLVGSVLPELQSIFDLYWNSKVVYPIESIARARPPADAMPGGQSSAFAAGLDTADSAVAQARSAFQPRI